MKRFAIYLNPLYCLKVMTVFKTPSETPHYQRAKLGLTVTLAIASVLIQVALRFWR